ncbi:MAG: hypothetical protein ACOC7X_13560 [Spirochaetota bacterium]
MQMVTYILVSAPIVQPGYLALDFRNRGFAEQPCKQFGLLLGRRFG